MKGRLLLACFTSLLAVGLAVYYTPVNALSPAGSEGEEVQVASMYSEETAPAPGDAVPLEPAAHCSNCVSSFCPANKVRCTWTGDCCAGKSHGNCEYTCVCDATCTDISTPSNACFTLPSEDCACRHVLCQTTWCKAQDLLCTAECNNGCCTYSNCTEQACNAEGCPPNACPSVCQ